VIIIFKNTYGVTPTMVLVGQNQSSTGEEKSQLKKSHRCISFSVEKLSVLFLENLAALYTENCSAFCGQRCRKRLVYVMDGTATCFSPSLNYMLMF
jgi:hypothetical protein